MQRDGELPAEPVLSAIPPQPPRPALVLLHGQRCAAPPDLAREPLPLAPAAAHARRKASNAPPAGGPPPRPPPPGSPPPLPPLQPMRVAKHPAPRRTISRWPPCASRSPR